MITTDRTMPDSGPVTGLAKSVTEIASDVLEIGELQTQLVREDFRTAAAQSKSAVGMIIAGIVMLNAGLPVALWGLSQWLSQTLQWPDWAAFMVVGFGLSGIAVGTVALAFRRAKLGLKAFERSSNELSYNFQWIKSLFR